MMQAVEVVVAVGLIITLVLLGAVGAPEAFLRGADIGELNLMRIVEVVVAVELAKAVELIGAVVRAVDMVVAVELTRAVVLVRTAVLIGAGGVMKG